MVLQMQQLVEQNLFVDAFLAVRLCPGGQHQNWFENAADKGGWEPFHHYDRTGL